MISHQSYQVASSREGSHPVEGDRYGPIDHRITGGAEQCGMKMSGQ
jgi:hypothetical protein